MLCHKKLPLVKQCNEVLKSKSNLRMKTAQSRQKSYDDRRRQPFRIQSGRFSISQCSAIDGRYTFWEEGQAESKVHRTFGILERVGEVAYKLALLSGLVAVHHVFHESMLRKYVSDPSLV